MVADRRGWLRSRARWPTISVVNDNPHSGRPSAAGAAATPAAVPTTLVFDGVASLADSLLGPAAAPDAPGAAVPTLDSERTEAVSDDERNRYGLLLDRAAERGLLDPTEYEFRLRELAEATSVARMMEIVTELPVFATPPPTTGRSARLVRSTGRATAEAVGQRRRATVWVVLAVLVVVVVAALVILTLSVERVARIHHSSQPPPPPAGRLVSGPRL